MVDSKLGPLMRRYRRRTPAPPPPMSDTLGVSDRQYRTPMPDLVPPDQLHQLALLPPEPALPAPLPGQALAAAGAAADAAAAARVFTAYRARMADETNRRHAADLSCFAAYLTDAGVAHGDLVVDPLAWRGVTWGLVTGFLTWQAQQGYAVSSINARLSAVKTYAKLATKAGVLAPDAYALIHMVAGYRGAEGRRLDAKRETTRKQGSKKAEPVRISREQADQLKGQPDPLSRLLMCLLLDHGLRVGEVASLTTEDFDLRRGVLKFYRSKVDKTQTHKLSADALAAAEAALGGAQADEGIWGVDRTIRRRVGALGTAVGLPKLSPHDCRHYWASAALRGGTRLKALQDAGGWSSPAMPLRYAESAEVANDGVKLD